MYTCVCTYACISLYMVYKYECLCIDAKELKVICACIYVYLSMCAYGCVCMNVYVWTER